MGILRSSNNLQPDERFRIKAKHVVCLNSDYLNYIRGLPCRTCGAPGPSDAHHVGNSGKKNHGNDALAMPLCRKCHSQYHQHEARAFEAAWNIDLKDELLCLLSEFLNQE